MRKTPPPDDPSWRDTGSIESDKQGIAVDVYGVKARLPHGAAGEHPKTWREVGSGVNDQLKNIAANAVGLVGDVFSAARAVVGSVGNFFIGTGHIPGEFAKRIGRGRALADQREDQRQQGDRALPDPADAKKARERLLVKLQELHAKGVSVGLVEIAPGKWGLIAVRPDLAEAAVSAAQAALVAPEPEVVVTTALSGGPISLSPSDVTAGALPPPSQDAPAE
jgi:hypothetical protein